MANVVRNLLFSVKLSIFAMHNKNAWLHYQAFGGYNTQ